MKAYIISDTHFNHEAIIKYCNRPIDHEVKLWNALWSLRANDLLIHLGDVCIGEDQINHSYIKDLPCRKVLVMGNHDSKSWSWYMDHGWDFVCDAFRLKYCGKVIMFSHIPQPWDGIWEVNVHGHLHNLGHRDSQLTINGLQIRQWHRLYAPELMGYKPIELSKLIQEDPTSNKPPVKHIETVETEQTKDT